MTPKPTIYLTNFASRRPPQRGPGRVLTIAVLDLTARPWSHGSAAGRVQSLTPHGIVSLRRRCGVLPKLYRRQFDDWARCHDLHPRKLVPEECGTFRGRGLSACDTSGVAWFVSDGDTLCCTCSREAAAKGECHRVWAADLLVESGWRVILDGVDRVL